MTIDQVKQLVLQKAAQYGIDPGVAYAQIDRESGFNPRAVGSSGERGLAQFMPGTWARFGSGSFDNAFDPELNLNAWGGYMTYLLGLFNGDYASALTGYNGGEGHLTNPEKYGPPSAAALEYGSTLAAYRESGADSGSRPDFLSIAQGGEFPWLAFGAVVAVGLFLAFRE